jgi:hypothetical protein
MDRNYRLVLERFSSELRLRLEAIFGKSVTGETLAIEFNLRASGCREITRETGRRWLIGGALPEYGRLVLLKQWLKLDMNVIFDTTEAVTDQNTMQNTFLTIDAINALDRISAEARILRESFVHNGLFDDGEQQPPTKG